MNGYDHTGMPYLDHPMSFTNTVTDDQYLNTLPTLGLQDHGYQQQPPPSFSTGDYVGNTNSIADISLAVPPETNRAFNNPYDDFQYDAVTHEAIEPVEQSAPEANTSLDRDDALLSFNPLAYNFALLDYSLHQVSVSLSARLHGMFFMADQLSASVSGPQTMPPELTCYRRNLFQVTGSITLPRSLRYILMDDGMRIPIVGQELQITATESVEGMPVKLISVPWKTPIHNPPSMMEDKTEKEPTTIPLDIMSNRDMDSDYATFPIAWKRLQFRIATANNGRRKELQQHFVARLKLVATLANGNKVPIAEAKSTAIVVRGRSPRNFQQKKDQAAGEEKGTTRKSLARRATTEAARSPLKRERSEIKHNDNNRSTSFSFKLTSDQPQAPNAFSNTWPKHTSGTSSAPALPTPTFKSHTFPSSKSNSSASPPSLPQPLSLTADIPTSQRPSKLPRTNSRPHPYKHPSLPSPRSILSSTQHNSLGPRREASDTADMLYEYFPLAADDWQKPVDAVYRPHVVHHLPLATGTTGARSGIGGRNQRYFSEDVS